MTQPKHATTGMDMTHPQHATEGMTHPQHATAGGRAAPAPAAPDTR